MRATSPAFAVLGFVPPADCGHALLAGYLNSFDNPADLELQTPCPKRQTLGKTLAVPVSVRSCVFV